jgi:hypothetical protein
VKQEKPIMDTIQPIVVRVELKRLGVPERLKVGRLVLLVTVVDLHTMPVVVVEAIMVVVLDMMAAAAVAAQVSLTIKQPELPIPKDLNQEMV